MTPSLSKSGRPAPATQHRWVIRRHSPWKHSIRVIVIALVLGGAGCGLFALGRASVSGNSTLASAEPCTNGDGRFSQLREDNAALRQQATILERTSQVERATYHRIGTSLKQLQNEILRLTEELAVYKGIVVRAVSNKGIVIQNVKLSPNKQARRYRYQVVLTHFGADKQVVSGSMQILVSGTQNGKAAVLSLGELAGEERGDPAIHLEFRNFVRVEGLLHLPPNFAPRHVRVRVEGTAKKQRTVERSFSWEQATS